jgi:acyl-CoA thioesterase I
MTLSILRLTRLIGFVACASISLLTSAGLAVANPSDREITILAFGDSLTAGYQLKPEDAFPAQLEMALRGEGYKVRVINAGVSGDTTAAGLARLDWSLQDGADAVIVELGANDALRGLPVADAKANLDAMLQRFSGKGMEILIAGMRAPGNWGRDYQQAFDGMFAELASKHGAALYPYFLDGVVINSPMVLPDGLHPSASGVAEIVKRILPAVTALVDRVQAKLAAAN